MGKISSLDDGHGQSQKEGPIIHFSHPHPLNKLNYNFFINNSAATCAGCKQHLTTTTPTPNSPSAVAVVYSCSDCSYFLHHNCFHMPKKITHPFHKEHALTLHPLPVYDEASFSCDACGETGSGFSYHCKPCGLDLHILCASMPLSVSHASHPHNLHLVFHNPYGEKAFSCDLCTLNGHTNWLYRCSSCGFDAHFNCARANNKPNHVHMLHHLNPQTNPSFSPQTNPHFSAIHPNPQTNPNFSAFHPNPQVTTTTRFAPPAPHPQIHGFQAQFGTGTTTRPPSQPHQPIQQQQQHAFPNPMMMNNNNINTTNNAAYGVPVGASVAGGQIAANREYEMALQAIQQMINNNNATTQALLANYTTTGGLGISYGGGGRMQQLTELISNINNGGYGGGGGGLSAFGGSGGGQDYLQALMNGGGGGGGGGGLDVLQNLMGGGGGGGLDILQNLIGGGGGGLDFLGGMLS